MSTAVRMAVIPPCDLCRSENTHEPASYDGKTVMGAWAYMCSRHFDTHGVGLGTGVGQRLVSAEEA